MIQESEVLMECYKCHHYESQPLWNCCKLTQSECFRTLDDCDLINDDGSINNEHEYFKANDMEAPYSKEEYEYAQSKGLDLDDWNDYCKFFHIGWEE